MDINAIESGKVLKFVAADLTIGQVVPVKKYGVESTVDTAVVIGQVNDTFALVVWNDGNGAVIQEAQVHISSVSKPTGEVHWELVNDKYNVCRRTYTEGNGECISDVDSKSRKIWKAKEMITLSVVDNELVLVPEDMPAIEDLMTKYDLPLDVVKDIFLSGIDFMAAKMQRATKGMKMVPIDVSEDKDTESK